MITLHWYSQNFTAEKAVRGADWLKLYDSENNEILNIGNISGREWQHIQLEGEWTDPSEIPTKDERLQADVDYLCMENEYLEGEADQARADIDYLLMITEE